MNTSKSDSEIKQLFSCLRAEDGKGAPSFERVFRKEHRKPEAPVRFLLRHKVAVGLFTMLILIVPGFLLLDRGSSGVDTAELSIDLYEWESPTSVLLDLPNESLLENLPEIETDWSWSHFEVGSTGVEEQR